MPSTRTLDNAEFRTLATGLLFPEGPVALDDGSVLVSEVEGAALARVAPDGTTTRLAVGELVVPAHDPYVANLCFGGDTAYICSSGRGILYAVEWPWPGLRLPFTC